MKTGGLLLETSETDFDSFHYDEKDGYDQLYIDTAEDVYDWNFHGEAIILARA